MKMRLTFITILTNDPLVELFPVLPVTLGSLNFKVLERTVFCYDQKTKS